MMRTLTLLLFATVFGGALQAQYSRIGHVDEWNTDSLQWYHVGRITNCYGPGGQALSTRGEVMENGAWLRADSAVFEYGENQWLTTLWKYEWDNAAQTWENFELSTQEYDSNGALAMQVVQIWDDTVWVNSLQYQNTYDGSGHPIRKLISSWNGSGWDELVQSLYTNDTEGHALVIQEDSLVSGSWVTYQIDSLTLDDDGREVLRDTWLTAPFLGLMHFVTIEQTYDADGVLETRTQYTMFPFPGHPVMIDTLTVAEGGDNFMNTTTQVNVADFGETPQWQNSHRNIWDPDRYPDCDVGAAVAELAGASRMAVFPNPTSGLLSVQLSAGIGVRSLAVLDATGRSVMELPTGQASGSVAVDLSRNDAGLYLVQVLFMDGTRAVERVVKE